MLIYLLRHGLTAYNAEKRYQGQRDIPLSPEGRAQLCRAHIQPKTVYITPLCRTRQTRAEKSAFVSPSGQGLSQLASTHAR